MSILTSPDLGLHEAEAVSHLRTGGKQGLEQRPRAGPSASKPMFLRRINEAKLLKHTASLCCACGEPGGGDAKATFSPDHEDREPGIAQAAGEGTQAFLVLSRKSRSLTQHFRCA